MGTSLAPRHLCLCECEGEGDVPHAHETCTPVHHAHRPVYCDVVPEKVERFAVTLYKTGTMQQLGMDIDVTDGSTMLVQSVHEDGGMVSAWNLAHPAYAVRAGDTIIEVNGVQGSAELMTVRCANDWIVDLKVQRGAPRARISRWPLCEAASSTLDDPCPPSCCQHESQQEGMEETT